MGSPWKTLEKRMLRTEFGPKMENVSGSLKKLLNEKLHNFDHSINITSVSKSRRMG
jgi:hypothetical protein